MIKLNRYPEGKLKAFTVSYDDGVVQDVRLTEMFREYGIKGTFNLNSELFEYVEKLNLGMEVKTERIHASDAAKLYEGFEVASHTCSHPMMNLLPDTLKLKEIMDDRSNLEELIHYPVRGLALPYGICDDSTKKIAADCGIEYIRMVEEDRSMKIPSDFMTWKPTCHHGVPELKELGKKFLEPSNEEKYLNMTGNLQLFYLWGHGYELDFERGGNSWSSLEDFLKMMSGKEEIWYASNIEIVDYVTALRNLKISNNGEYIYNPSCLDVWVSVDEKPVCIKHGMVYAR